MRKNTSDEKKAVFELISRLRVMRVDLLDICFSLSTNQSAIDYLRNPKTFYVPKDVIDAFMTEIEETETELRDIAGSLGREIERVCSVFDINCSDDDFDAFLANPIVASGGV